MKNKMKNITILPAILLINACSIIPSDAYFSRGEPESLLDVSSEIVSVRIESERSIDELIDWIDSDQPSNAELYCYDGNVLCAAAEEVMALYGVEYELVDSGDNIVNLSYNRILARDCENRYMNNSINPYNLNHPTFGCSIASNMVQMVSDKGQFVSPELTGFGDGNKAVQAYGTYIEGDSQPEDDSNFSVEDISLE